MCLSINVAFGARHEMQRNIIEKKDFEVEVGYSLEKGKEKFNLSYSLIILDMNLPDGTGYEFFSFIKSKSNIPIIFLTVRNDDEEIVRGLDLGADDYITKPFKLSIIEEMMDGIITFSANKNREVFIENFSINK